MSEETLEIAPLIYVAGKYGDVSGYEQVSKNVQVARDAAVWLAGEGLYFVCPHLNSNHMECSLPSVSVQHWYAQDLRLMETCDAMIVVGEWQKSRGVNKELQVAGKKGMPIFDLNDAGGKAELLAWRDEWVAKKLGEQLMTLIGNEDTEATIL